MTQTQKIAKARTKTDAILSDLQSRIDASIAKSSIEPGLVEVQSILSAEEKTTEIGYVNINGQVVIRNTGGNGTDYNQYVYQVACSNYGSVYGANGSDIFERKCPRCQHGKEGLSL